MRMKEISQFLHIICLLCPRVNHVLAVATFRDCACLNRGDQGQRLQPRKEQLVADRSREVTVLSQYRLPGKGYRAEGKGGQVLLGELLLGEACVPASPILLRGCRVG